MSMYENVCTHQFHFLTLSVSSDIKCNMLKHLWKDFSLSLHNLSLFSRCHKWEAFGVKLAKCDMGKRWVKIVTLWVTIFFLDHETIFDAFLKVKLKAVKIKRGTKAKTLQLYKSQAPMKTGHRVSGGVGHLYFSLRIFCEK